MVAACDKSPTLYRPRDPQASDLWRLIDEHFDTFQQVYDERYQAKYGFWRPVIEHSVTAFLKCGDLQEGFARVRCSDCKHEMFVAFSCKQRCTCPSCHQKRTLLTGIHVSEDVCAPVAHRQVVFTIPKRLRIHARFDRKLLGKLSSCAWTCIKAEVRRILKREDVVPGMIAAIQTFGQLAQWHPHLHCLLTCGAFTPEGEFLELPQFDMDSLLTDTGQVVYKAEKDACRAFPNPQSTNLTAGTKRNFQILSPLDFLAEFTQHIPPKGSHIIRYFGFYSNKNRGMRKKAKEAANPPSQGDARIVSPARCSQTWAMLIKRVYEVDPMVCSQCGGEMEIISFIDPPQNEVIEKILRHCGLWMASEPRGPPDPVGLSHDPDAEFMNQSPELTFVDMDTFQATF